MSMSMEQAREQVDRATALYQAGEYQQAADLFGELFLEPEALAGSNEIHWNYAMCLAHLGQLQLAEQHVAAGGYSVSDFHQQYARSVFEFGVQAYNAGDWRQAADRFAELLLLPGFDASGMPDVHWNLALCFARMGDPDTALAHLRAGHCDEEEFRRLAAAEGLHGFDMVVDAETRFREGERLFQDGRYEEAADVFAEVLLMPGSPAGGMGDLHWNIGLCYAHLGNWQLAFEHARVFNNDPAAFRDTCIQRGLQPPEEHELQ